VITSQTAVVTTTFYSLWCLKPADCDHTNPITLINKIRGDLALKAIGSLIAEGYQVVVVDGGSSEAFINELRELGVNPLPEFVRGMSASRQLGFLLAAWLPGVEYIVWMEPEKVDFVNHIAKCVQPIANDDADVIIPSRDSKLMDETYPDYQVTFERKANTAFTQILRAASLWNSDEVLDAWIGPRVFRNTPELVRLFTQRHKSLNEDNKNIRPDLWSDSLFSPIPAALHNGFKVGSVEIAYKHPAIQTQVETDNPVFKQKRSFQHDCILKTTKEMIKLLNDEKSLIAQA